MKNIVFILLVLGLFLLSACTLEKESAPKKEITQKINLKMEDFKDFTNLPYSYGKSTWEETIRAGEYNERMFYNLFNELYYPGTKPDSECVENQETYECLYFYAILNNREDLCEYFPEEREVTLHSAPGSTNVTVYYKDSCIVYVRVYKIYMDSENKLEFCNSFSEDYIKEMCEEYTALKSY